MLYGVPANHVVSFWNKYLAFILGTVGAVIACIVGFFVYRQHQKKSSASKKTK
jgi:hypothetical protein